MVGQQELTASVLTTLRVPMRVAWWRMPTAVEPPPSTFPAVRDFKVIPTHILNLNEDPDAYWRQSHYSEIRTARRKSARFQFVVNPPDGLRWTIYNWEKKWRPDPACPMVDVGDRLAADEFLQERGQHFTFALLDGEQFIAGAASVVDGGDLVQLVPYRRPEYDRYYIGHALTDHVVDWAKRSGYQGFDLGGKFTGGNSDYKIKVAPFGGEKIEFEIRPVDPYVLGHLRKYGRALRRVWSRCQPARSAF